MTTVRTDVTSPTGQSARIIPFPIRERVAAQALPVQRFAAMEAIARRQAPNVASGSWYHEAAIADAADDRG